MADNEPETASGGKTAPPYVSYRTMKTFVQDLHEHEVPGKIDKDVTKRFSGSVAKQLMTAIRFLELVDKHDTPRPKLFELSETFGTDRWSSSLSDLLRTQYAPIFKAVDLASTTPTQVHAAFKDTYGGKDDVLKKCELFFLQAAKEAGIPLSKRITVTTRTRGPNKAKRVISRNENTGPEDNPHSGTRRKHRHVGHDDATQGAYQVLVNILDPVSMSEDERKAVFTLIEYLKRREIEAAAGGDDDDVEE
jgi:hypothetical protein